MRGFTLKNKLLQKNADQDGKDKAQEIHGKDNYPLVGGKQGPGKEYVNRKPGGT
jgi:hypothetical protein